MKKFLPLLACAALTFPAGATVTLNINVADLRTGTGAIIDSNTTLILVADASGFNMGTLSADLLGLNLTIGSTFGVGGQIIDIIGASDLGSGDYGYNLSNTYDLTALGLVGADSPSLLGSQIAVMWFPGRTGILPQAVLSNGESYGFYRSDTIDGPSLGDQSFNMPADGASLNIFALDTTLGGGIPTESLWASGLVGSVPEPSRGILALLGLGLAVLRRHRCRA